MALQRAGGGGNAATMERMQAQMEQSPESANGFGFGWGESVDEEPGETPGINQDPLGFDDPAQPLDVKPNEPPPPLELEIANDNGAPASGDKARTKVGIGERSGISANLRGAKWSADKGTAKVDDNGQLAWIAPSVASTATITCTVDAQVKKLTIQVVAPTSVTGKKTSETSAEAGVLGSGMRLNLTIGPTDVSFFNVSWLETEGAIRVVKGFKSGVPPVAHNPDWLGLSAENTVGDTAEIFGYPLEGPGRLEHDINQNYRVGDTGPATKFAMVTQVHEVLDAVGTAQTTKAGAASAPRKP